MYKLAKTDLVSLKLVFDVLRLLPLLPYSYIARGVVVPCTLPQ